VDKKGTRGKIDPKFTSKILRMVPDKKFSFATDVGVYTGDFANSLTDFVENLSNISLKSIEFHLYPRPPDFERWIREAIGDESLADTISKINKSITGEELRKTLQSIVKNRIYYLKVTAMTKVKGIGPKWSKRLIAADINHVDNLANYHVKDLAKKIGVSEKTATKWIENAKALLRQGAAKLAEKKTVQDWSIG
jgi:predicted flap endonuclease-1-like 5' DNA nuclease